MIVAPASPPHSIDVFKRAQKRLQDVGFNVVLGGHSQERLGFLAGADSVRLLDLSEALTSPSIKGIFCIRGGYGSGRIVKEAPFNALQSHPKILVGSSDLTTLLYGCTLSGGTVSFHGPTLQSLVDDTCPDFTWLSFLQMVTGDPASLGSILKNYQSNTQIENLYPGSASGRLVGGNLSILLSLIGTRFFPDLSDSILFLEDIGQTPFRIDRCLTQLLNIGALDTVRGFALGIFEQCSYRPEDAPHKQTLRDVFLDRLAPLGKPIVCGLPFGHTPFNATLPVGTMATLDANTGDLIIDELPVL